MEAIERLMRMCPPPSTLRATVARAAEGATVIPASHRELNRVYGAGWFDEFICVYAENQVNPFQDLWIQTDQTRRSFRTKGSTEFARILKQEGVVPESLIKWGVTENADLFMWIPVGHPDEWKTIALEVGQLSFAILDKTSPEIVADLIAGTLKLSFMPDDFPSDEPRFSPDGAVYP